MRRSKDDLEAELESLREKMERAKEGQARRNRKYTNNTVDTISFTVPKGKKAAIKARADELGMSVNQYISTTILADADPQPEE